MSEGPVENTDRELWRNGDRDGNGMSYYEPSIHVTKDGLIGINVGGSVVVMPVEAWHALAAAPTDRPEGGELLDKLRDLLPPTAEAERVFDGITASLAGAPEGLREALREAIKFAEEGWDYAPAYFRKKWGYESGIAKLRSALASASTGETT